MGLNIDIDKQNKDNYYLLNSYKGIYDSIASVYEAHPEGKPSWFALVGGDSDTFVFWDKDTNSWLPVSYGGSGGSGIPTIEADFLSDFNAISSVGLYSIIGDYSGLYIGTLSEGLLKQMVVWDNSIYIRSINVSTETIVYPVFSEIDNVDLSDYLKKEDITITTSDPTAIAVGGVTAGTNLQGKSALEVIDIMLYPELFPTITEPSQTFTISPSATYQEVGTVLTVVELTGAFNRGAINPQYTAASPYRAGALLYHIFNGAGMLDPVETYPDYGVENYTIVLGANTWTCNTAYATGVQPKSSKGNNYSTALIAGSTSTITQTITGVYPLYATVEAIATLSKLTLQAHGTAITVNMVAENGTDKQKIQVPTIWKTLVSIQQFNTLSGAWDTIDKTSFSGSTAPIGGVTYTTYTHNGATIGARQLKFNF